MPKPKNTIESLISGLEAQAQTLTDEEVRKDLARMPVLLVNPYASSGDLELEANVRLEAAKEMLNGVGSSVGEHFMTEDFQGVCTAASKLIGDSMALIDYAIKRASEEGGHGK